ncbi:mate-domain-containing protein [Hypomontagnella monticulosa]|nr:mate-domain-containing protein [Hypomontagnella monticulosa]
MSTSSRDEELSSPSLENGHSETTPLLQGQGPVIASNGTQTEAHPIDQQKGLLVTGTPDTSWKREARTIVIWSAPLIMTYLLQRSINMVGIFIVGRIGTKELGAVSLSSITTNMIGNHFIQGLANTLDTLAAQAYGSGNKHLVGLHTQRMICFILVCVVPLMVLWWMAEDILVFIVPDREVVELAGNYLRIMILRMPAFVLFDCGRRFFQAQGIFHATTYVLLIAAPFNAFIMWLFVWHFGLGFVGAPIAIVITENLMVILLFLYGWLINGSQCWARLSRAIFKNWRPMIRLAVPGMIMHITEFATEEALTLAAARFGTAQLAAQSALVTLVSTTYIVPLGVSMAASIRVANWIGAEATSAAKFSARVAVVFGIILSTINTVLLGSLRYKVPYLFTHDTEVIDILVKAIPIITIMQTFDTMAAFSHGLLRSIGCQEFAGYLNLVVYYAIALPISFCTAFLAGWKLYGLWAGMTSGLCIVSVVEFWWLYRSDWDHAVNEAVRRNESG